MQRDGQSHHTATFNTHRELQRLQPDSLTTRLEAASSGSTRGGGHDLPSVSRVQRSTPSRSANSWWCERISLSRKLRCLRDMGLRVPEEGEPAGTAGKGPPTSRRRAKGTGNGCGDWGDVLATFTRSSCCRPNTERYTCSERRILD